jgi:crossover junction endodeoxyribonuclease RuvC
VTLAPGAMVKIVGIDPGLAATGVGVVRGRGTRLSGYSFGCITTSPSDALPERLNRIFSRLHRLLSSEAPDLVVIEDVFSLQEYPKSGIGLGQVSGVIMLAAAQCGLRCAQVPVREAKQVLTGNGNASKSQLERAVRLRLDHPSVIRPSHAADALGLAIIGLQRWGAPGALPAAARGRRPARKGAAS